MIHLLSFDRILDLTITGLVKHLAIIVHILMSIGQKQ